MPKHNSRHRRGGRPTKYRTDTILVVLLALLAGSTIAGAAAMARVAPSTVYLWMQWHPLFREAVQEARRGSLRQIASTCYPLLERFLKLSE